jgi:hypothetical protein
MSSGAQEGERRTRPIPFATGLPGRKWVEKRFAAIETEARSRGSDLLDPAAFLLLAQVGVSLQDLRPDDAETTPELFHTFGSFLFHAFHLLHGESPGLLLDLEPGAARYLVEARPTPEGWDHSLPASAGYLRLPPHLFWTRPAGDSAPAEAVDGISWCMSAHANASGLSLLVITGVRADRPGFSVLPLPVVSMADVGSWLGRRARPDGAGEDFQTTLPGGDLGNLYSMETAGETLKLVARALGYAMTVPGAMSEVAGPAPLSRDSLPEQEVDDMSGDMPSIHGLLTSATLRLV